MEADSIYAKLLKNFIAGGFGALVTDFIFYPVDTLKTRLQAI